MFINSEIVSSRMIMSLRFWAWRGEWIGFTRMLCVWFFFFYSFLFVSVSNFTTRKNHSDHLLRGRFFGNKFCLVGVMGDRVWFSIKKNMENFRKNGNIYELTVSIILFKIIAETWQFHRILILTLSKRGTVFKKCSRYWNYINSYFQKWNCHCGQTLQNKFRVIA